MTNIQLDKLSNLVKPYYENNITTDDLNVELNSMIAVFENNLKYFKVTDTNYVFSQLNNPFFMVPNTRPITTDNQIVDDTSDDTSYDPIYTNILETCNKSSKRMVFNPYFIMLYLTAKSESKAFSIGNWTLFSLQQVVDDFNVLLLEEPEITWCTLGNKYMGLGYYYALRMDVTNGRLFMQTDGGSNDWDRLHYWEQYKNQKIKEDEYIEYPALIELLNSNNN